MSPSMLSDGAHPVIARDHYDRIDRTNFSTLKHIGRSPAHYHHRRTKPPQDTDAMKVGRVSHVATFEPERFLNSIAVWDGGTRRGKDWEAFKARNEGRELLTENEHTKCLSIQNAVRNSKLASRYVQKGRGEMTMLWTTELRGNKIPCKGRIDFDSQSAIVDLKTTKDASPDAFGRQCYDLHYATQAAWYVDGYFLATGIRKPYVVVAVENVEPFVVQPYTVPEDLLDIGRTEYLGWLDKLIFCREQNWWPGYADSELELTLPRWAYPPEDQDITDEGLTSGGEPLAAED